MSEIITARQIKEISGGKATDTTCESMAILINMNSKAFKLDSNLRLAYFLGHCCVESWNFTKFEESLYYSASRLRAVWPSRFPNNSVANKYAKNPKALANYVYNGRMGNRSGTDDGWNYRGGGMKQLTGSDNYHAFNEWIHKQPFGNSAPDFVKNPDAVRSFPWAFYSAVWFWVENKVYKHADRDDILASTKTINGGTNGLKDRTVAINRAKKILVAEAGPTKTKKAPKKADQLLKTYQEKLNQIAKFRDEKKFDVGKADGWMGPKTEKAVKAFQKSADLKQDGILGPKTREAIDNALAIIEQARSMPVALISKPEVIATSKEVVEVPADVPEELDKADKPLFESKTVLTAVLGSGTFITSLFSGALNFFNNLTPMIQALLILMLFLTIVLGYMAVRDRIRMREGVRKLKKEQNRFENFITTVSEVIVEQREER